MLVVFEKEFAAFVILRWRLACSKPLSYSMAMRP